MGIRSTNIPPSAVYITNKIEILEGEIATKLLHDALQTPEGRKALVKLIDKAIVKGMPIIEDKTEQELIKKYRQLSTDGKEEILSFIEVKLQLQNKRNALTQNAAG